VTPGKSIAQSARLLAQASVAAAAAGSTQPEVMLQDHVDVFGALAARRGDRRAEVERDKETGEVKLVGEKDYDGGEGVLHVMLPNGEEFRITKGLRIPYTYKDVDGGTVYANILVLYNGNGH
jgi:hypothetical protein